MTLSGRLEQVPGTPMRCVQGEKLGIDCIILCCCSEWDFSCQNGIQSTTNQYLFTSHFPGRRHRIKISWGFSPCLRYMLYYISFDDRLSMFQWVNLWFTRLCNHIIVHHVKMTECFNMKFIGMRIRNTATIHNITSSQTIYNGNCTRICQLEFL